MNRYINYFIYNDYTFYYCDLKRVFSDFPTLEKLPNCLKILLESNLRNAIDEQCDEIINIFVNKARNKQLQFSPNRILMQDNTAVPIFVDLASMRDKLKKENRDVKQVNPKLLVDLVIDHSLIIEKTNTYDSIDFNLQREFKKNAERYHFLKWASTQFENLSVVPPGFGISHQINLEYFSTMINVSQENGKIFIYPETMIGTDTHTSMINSLGILAWEVGGLEAQCLMFDTHTKINLPRVIGIELSGSIASGVTTSDIVLSLTSFLNESQLSAGFLEFYGDGVKSLTLEDRATISNMANEYNVAVSFFSIDSNTLDYIKKTRGVDTTLIKNYYSLIGLYDSSYELEFDEVINFDLSQVEPIICGPYETSQKIKVKKVPSKLKSFKRGNLLKDNDIVQASIVSCMSTSNPKLIIQAALLAKNAISFGLEINSNIKKVFTPGSYVVKKYLKELDLLKYFEYIGFDISGYGCTTCFKSRGHLLPGIEDEILKYNLDVSSISSGNRNFKENVNPHIKSNWLASPALVLAYCFKGSINCNIQSDEIAKGVLLSDIWPNDNLVDEYLKKIDSTMFLKSYADIYKGNSYWHSIITNNRPNYDWSDNCTYIQQSQLFEKSSVQNIDIQDAKIVAILGDDVLNEHISPMGAIKENTQAAKYLKAKNLDLEDFDTYENRKGNSELMIRGILSSDEIQNKIIEPKVGGYTKDFSSDEVVSIFEFCEKMNSLNRPMVLFAGKNFGSGIIRDWAAKGLSLLGIKAIIAESFDHNFKSNLVRVGILPLELTLDSISSLKLDGNENISIKRDILIPNEKIEIFIKKDTSIKTTIGLSKLENKLELDYFKSGGALNYLLENLN